VLHTELSFVAVAMFSFCPPILFEAVARRDADPKVIPSIQIFCLTRRVLKFVSCKESGFRGFFAAIPTKSSKRSATALMRGQRIAQHNSRGDNMSVIATLDLSRRLTMTSSW
jgi:hypothetical protein